MRTNVANIQRCEREVAAINQPTCTGSHSRATWDSLPHRVFNSRALGLYGRCGAGIDSQRISFHRLLSLSWLRVVDHPGLPHIALDRICAALSAQSETCDQVDRSLADKAAVGLTTALEAEAQESPSRPWDWYRSACLQSPLQPAMGSRHSFLWSQTSAAFPRSRSLPFAVSKNTRAGTSSRNRM